MNTHSDKETGQQKEQWEWGWRCQASGWVRQNLKKGGRQYGGAS